MIYRIAVCLSGEPRTWKTAAPSVLSYFDVKQAHDGREVEVDYFIHTWATNSWKTGEKAVRADTSGIHSAYRPKGIKVESQKLRNNVWGSLFESQYRSFLSKRDYEVEQQGEYDLVIKSRLDTIFPPGEVFQTHPVSLLTAYAPEPLYRMPNEYNAPNFNEVMYYGDSRTMDLIGEVGFAYERDCDWSSYHQLSTGLRERPTQKMGPGAYMFDYMSAHRINPTHAPRRINWTIVRQSAEGMDVVNDYEKIVDIHRRHYLLDA